MVIAGAFTSMNNARRTASKASTHRELPARVRSASGMPECALSIRMFRTSSVLSSGLAAMTSAATPATNGVAKLVPQTFVIVKSIHASLRFLANVHQGP